MLDNTNDTNAFDKWRQGVDWRVDLILTQTRNSRTVLANALIALRKAPEWQGAPCL